MAGRAEQALERMIALTEGRQYARPARAIPGVRAVSLVAAIALSGLVLVLAALVAFGTVVDNPWYRIIAMEGVSMEPTIRAGDALLVTEAPERLRPGMIVVLDVGGRLVVHRVIASKPDGSFTTKGDANRYTDSWQKNEANVTVEGLYRGRVPLIGRLLRW